MDSRHVCLVTDDREPGSLVRQGHMDHVIRRAIEEGVDPVVAIQMATINPAEHYEMGRFLGSICAHEERRSRPPSVPEGVQAFPRDGRRQDCRFRGRLSSQ